MVKSEKILELIDMFPWITPELIAKHIESEVWMKDSEYAYVKAYNHLRSLEKQGKIVVASSERKIYRRKGSDKRVGMFYFHHNQAVISVLMNLYLKGYDVNYSGAKNSDGLIGKIALEVDRGNHTKNADIEKQITKYGEDIEKVLFVSFPKYAIRQSEKDQDVQFSEMNRLRKKIQSLNLPKRLTSKLYFATYIEASTPLKDPLKEKVWKTLCGKNTSVV